MSANDKLTVDEDYLLVLTSALQSLCLMTGHLAVHDLLQEDYEKWRDAKCKDHRNKDTDNG